MVLGLRDLERKLQVLEVFPRSGSHLLHIIIDVLKTQKTTAFWSRNSVIKTPALIHKKC